MARICKVCKICGKSYEACRTPARPGVYRWQDVACCPEHGAEYLEKVNAARNPAPKAEPTKKRRAPVVEAVDTVSILPAVQETAEVVSETDGE